MNSCQKRYRQNLDAQKQKGSFEDFTIVATLDNLGAGKSETDIQVVGAHTSGDASIVLDGFTANQTGALKADILASKD